MKKQLLLSTIAFYLSTFAFAQQYSWKDISANIPLQGGLNDVIFIGQEGWIAGPNDAVFYTPDGGATFEVQELPEMPGIDGISLSVFMKNAEEGYVTTNSGEINKTENGGNNWIQLYDLGGFLYKSVHCPPNSDTCYTCGGNGKVWKFTDDYIVDISVGGSYVSNLSCILFPESNEYGVFCGESIIRRYFNNTWNNLIFYDNTYFYNSISCIDNDNCWAVGTLGTIIKTTDGVEWTIRWSGPEKELQDVFFVDSLEGWAAGSEILLHTTDGGESWTEITPFDFTGIILTALWFNSPTEGYMVSNKGNLYKYTEVSGIADDGLEELAFDVYPNPAKEKFGVRNLEFGIKDLSIELYDLNGRKLLEKQIPAGSESVEIDVSYLNNGVYFCKIITDKGNATKKLIIQK